VQAEQPTHKQHSLSPPQVTVSFGGCSSLISLPCFMSHASIPAEVRAARGLPDDLVRISAGIEGAFTPTHAHALLTRCIQAMLTCRVFLPRQMRTT
jgi:cystathionine beta-lyase/cystathionine gamma-synthase